MKSLLTSKYFLAYLFIYAICAVVAMFVYHLEAGDVFGGFLIIGVLFSAIAWLSVRKINSSVPDKPAFTNEAWVLIGLIVYITFYLAIGTTLLNKLIPKQWLDNDQISSVIKVIKKLLLFVLIPFLIYKSKGFSLRDFGFAIKRGETFGKKQLIAFFIISVVILLFDYFISGGSKPLRDGQLTGKQLAIGLPAVFLWMSVEAGLVEEFFFRALLQSRISVLLKSPVAGIVISGLIFGLAHAPGLFLRGTGSDEGLGQHPSLWFCIAYCVVVLSAAGFFLAIVWQKTKNIYLVIALHAMVDFMPNVSDFVKTWNI